MKKQILIFGKNGQVASNLIKILNQEESFEFQAFSSSEVDFSNLEKLQFFLNNLKTAPDFIINAAAYNAVDKAEEEKGLVDLINNRAVKVIAEYAAKNNVILIYYSSDYVFDGAGNKPFKEDNSTNLHPLNYYGVTKLAGENSIINSGCKYLIFRISWVYDENGKNFVNTIKKLAQEKEELKIVDDQIGSPTEASYIAKSTIKIIKQLMNWQEKFPSGIYHLTSDIRYVSWYDFACEIIRNLKAKNVALKVKKIIPIKSSEYKTTAKRPLNSRLDCSKISKTFLKKM